MSKTPLRFLALLRRKVMSLETLFWLELARTRRAPLASSFVTQRAFPLCEEAPFSKGALWGRDPAATGRRRNDALLYVNNSMFYCNTLYLNERVSQDSQASFTGRAFGKTFVWRICLLQYVCFGKERFLHVFKTFLKMQCIIKHHFLLIHDTLLIPW